MSATHNNAHNNDISMEQEQSVINNCWNTIGIWGSKLPRCEKLEQHIHCRNCNIYSEASRKVLERNLTKNYERDWASVYSQDKQEHITKKESLTIFRIGDETMAIPTEYIMSINDIGNIHTIPHQNSNILRGLINLRGELKICISLGRLLGLNKAVKSIDTMHRIYNRMVEISKDGKEYIFVASEVLGVHQTTEKGHKDVPATISQSKGTFTKSLIEWKGIDVSYLDIELIFYNLDKNLL